MSTLFILIQTGHGPERVGQSQHLANILGDKPWLAVDQHGADFLLAVAVLDPRKKEPGKG